MRSEKTGGGKKEKGGGGKRRRGKEKIGGEKEGKILPCGVQIQSALV